MTATEWIDRVDAVRAGLVDRRDTPEGMGQAYALATAVLPQALAALRAVLALTYASDAGNEWRHLHPREEGEPECPACWAADIRRAIEEALA